MAEDEARAQEELLRQLEDEFRRLRIEDVLAQTVMTVSQLGFRRMSPEDRDLAQARLAIEALRALVPVLSEALPEQAVRDFNSVIANMQLAYARAAAETPAPEGDTAS